MTALPQPITVRPELSIETGRPILPPEHVIFGRSAAMQVVRHHLEKVKGNNVPVLIQGESGTGKEIIAGYLHHRSPWSDGPLVKVSCPAIPSTLLESELFGYERGAFTGAYTSKPGRVEMAHRGTLFLDEIGELDPGLQAKLLQLLQNGQFSRIGSQHDKTVDVRVVCATNRDLSKETAKGTFRQDLYYRINVVSLRLPPLRERRSDIPNLVQYFLDFYGRQRQSETRPISKSLMKLFEVYEWPGNIRQLENIVRRYSVLGSEDSISEELLSQPRLASEPEIVIGDQPISLKKIAREVSLAYERQAILKALQVHQWNRKRAARSLSISYRGLLNKMREAGLPARNGNARSNGDNPSETPPSK
jgi:two-component system, NtrC family, response regulator AtoC